MVGKEVLAQPSVCGHVEAETQTPHIFPTNHQHLGRLFSGLEFHNILVEWSIDFALAPTERHTANHISDGFVVIEPGENELSVVVPRALESQDISVHELSCSVFFWPSQVQMLPALCLALIATSQQKSVWNAQRVEWRLNHQSTQSIHPSLLSGFCLCSI